MADYAWLDKTSGRYVLGPPVHIVSENTNPLTTYNPAFELGYWRFGLRTALTWGWDFPMVAMAAARTGNPKLAVDMLLYNSPGFRFDEHGLATGGPFPYFPSNGAL